MLPASTQFAGGFQHHHRGIPQGPFPGFQLEIQVGAGAVPQVKGLPWGPDPATQLIQFLEIVGRGEDVGVARGHQILAIHEQHTG